MRIFNAEQAGKDLYQSSRYIASLAFLLSFSAWSHASDDVVKRLANQYDVSRLEFSLMMIKPKVLDEVTKDLVPGVFKPGEVNISSAVGAEDAGIGIAAFIESFRVPKYLEKMPRRFELISDRAARAILFNVLGNYGDQSYAFYKSMGYLFSSAREMTMFNNPESIEELGRSTAAVTYVVIEVRLGAKVKRFRYKADIKYDISKVEFPDSVRELVFEHPKG